MYHIIRHLQVFKVTVVIPLSLITSYIPLLFFMLQPRYILMARMKFLRYSALFTMAAWPMQQLVLLIFSSSLPYLFLPLPFACFLLCNPAPSLNQI